MMTYKQITERLQEFKEEHPEAYYTIETSFGETYSNDEEYVVYGHYVQPESSVLYGGPDSRCWLACADDRSTLVKAAKALGHDCDDIEGTTYVPVEEAVAHIREDNPEDNCFSERFSNI